MADLKEAILRSFTQKQYQNIRIKKRLFSNIADVTAYHPRLGRTEKYHCRITSVRGVRKLEVQQEGFPYPVWVDDLM